ncbi:aminotransferase class V-fold PLP-dependent enzyme [Thiohalomonas denitrificans]|uniref:dTDP-4-amino-4,6-dideoxygalactose transaminase n=1 Tax=Thiohalomonas denitrificans TaxID=415747 RepID=A0A1G5Q2N2_9GAMM|nr:aminotransferase class V-fold PLP-dependent enzyme [Thiohalomonas denitrificans]SCZ55922.1 dTDP-4-amino-4,6-dideoxygalactose transaminase [Thiohalomonas denitrificans]
MMDVLPPAGEPISIRSGFGISANPFDLPYDSVHFYGSGTAALAAAMRAAISLAEQPSPEIIIPAYGCPSLISAARYAPVCPVLVDLHPETPWLDIREVESHVTDNTVAILAINLFGIPERLEALRGLARKHHLFLIEDGAQSFFHDLADGPRSDFLVLSFGRGKPVSLLGGGSVLARTKLLADYLPAPDSTASPSRFRIAAIAYNLLRNPHLYWIPKRLPGLSLGETSYSPLRSLTAMDAARIRALTANIAAARCRTNDSILRMHHAIAPFHANAVVLDLLAFCCEQPFPRLSRYPLLLPDRNRRDTLLKRLDAAGLGATAMYQTPLPEIPGIDLGVQSFPAAGDFADRLITLPIHSGVTDRHISAIVSILGDFNN